MHRQVAARPLTLTLAWVAVGCVEPNALPNDATETRDSSGITIVTSSAPLLPIEEPWIIESTPILQIGAIEGDSAYLFGQIWDAARLKDGRIVVSDGRSLGIRIYDKNGRFQAGFGGRGDGPAEFGGPAWVTFAPPDTLIVWDSGHERLSRFDLTGSLQSQILLRETINDHSITRLGGGFVWQVAQDGAILSTGPVRSTNVGEGLNEEMRRFVLLEPSRERSHDFGEFPGGQGSRTRGSGGILLGIENPYGQTTIGVLGPPSQRFSIAANESWEIRTYTSDGTLVRIMRATIPLVSVDATIETERDRMVTIGESMGLTTGEANAAFDRFELPDSVPPIAAMYWDDSGNLWVGRRTALILDVDTYDVFDGNGAWLTTVQVPPDLRRIHEIGDSHLLATWTDDLDVPYLRMYRIEKPVR